MLRENACWTGGPFLHRHREGVIKEYAQSKGLSNEEMVSLTCKLVNYFMTEGEFMHLPHERPLCTYPARVEYFDEGEYKVTYVNISDSFVKRATLEGGRCWFVSLLEAMVLEELGVESCVLTMYYKTNPDGHTDLCILADALSSGAPEDAGKGVYGIVGNNSIEIVLLDPYTCMPLPTPSVKNVRYFNVHFVLGLEK